MEVNSNETKNFHLHKHPRESLKSTFITDDRISGVWALYFTYGDNEFWRAILPHIGSKFHIYFVTSIECSSDSNDSNQWATKSLQRWRIRNQYIATACIATGDIFSVYQCLFFYNSHQFWTFNNTKNQWKADIITFHQSKMPRFRKFGIFEFSTF